jgi:N-methylhydantoinase A
LLIGTDIGGTFTDFVAIDPESGAIWLEKTLTTPADPAQGIMNGLDSLQQGPGVAMRECATLVHGTTLVINALIERKGRKTGLITTQGFRDVLEMRNGLRYDVYDLQLEFPEPLVPRHLRLEVAERTWSDGRVARRPSEADLRRIVGIFKEAGVASVAVCLLNAHANSSNEKAIERMLKELAPELFVSVSSDVLPQIKEYERSSTTVANAYVKPTVGAYLDRLAAGLARRDFDGSLFVMQSGGGVVDRDFAGQYPIRMLESGPAGGVAAARWWGGKAGEKNLLCFDMGGTTAKLCTVIDGQALVTDEYEAARLHHFKRGSGLAVNVPVLDLLEIGTGGGSVAHIDKLGLLAVGPESAGAAPGPACYGLGGERPTVTDADVVLGYLDPANFLGGSLTLDRSRACAVMQAAIADLLPGLDDVEAAYCVHNLANEDMASAARLHLAERGESAGGLVMIAYGGAGPVHAYGLAHKLGIRRLIIPPAAGVMSAMGMLVEDPATDQIRSFRQALDELDVGTMARQFDQMLDEMAALLHAGSGEVRGLRSVELRYRGQGYNVRIPVLEDDLSDSGQAGALLRARFEQAYESRYGRIYDDVPLDLVNLQLTAVRPRQAPAFEPRRLETGGPQPSQPARRRSAYFGPESGTLECGVYDRATLRPGCVYPGPAFIEERETTVVVGPRGSFRVDPLGMIVVEVA